MLKELRIQNFQKHKKLKIPLDDKITTIIGPSDTGKSSILRAIRWVMYNKPTGSNFIKKDSEFAKVSLLAEENIITRKRSKKDNLYTLNDNSFAAFGNDVPEIISKTLNISDLNFQNQHEAPFWFNLSSGEVSRQLNSIINLGIIDSTLSYLDSKKRKSGSVINVIEERLQEMHNKKKTLSFLKDMKTELTDLETKNKNLLQQKDIITTLEDLINKSVICNHLIEKARKLKSQSETVLKKGEYVLQQLNSLLELKKLIKAGVDYQKILLKQPPSITELEKKATYYDNINRQKNLLFELIGKAQQWDDLCYLEKQKRKRIEKEITALIGKRCPLCQQPIKEKNQ